MPVGLLSFGAPLFVFNGGRSQVGLGSVQSDGSYPFMNFVKATQYWTWINGASSPVAPDTLDENGYPTSIVNGGVFTRCFIPTQSARPGQYKVTWKGIGTIYLPNATSPTGSKTSATADGGSFTFTPTSETIDIGISSIGATRVTDLKLYHINDDADILAGKVFGTEFKRLLKTEGRFGVIRFMDWQGTNTSAVTTWWTRRAASYVTYGSTEYRPSIYAGTTSNTGNDYTVSAPAMSSALGAAWDGVLRNKTTVIVTFNVSATQSGLCSLDVGGTGAKNILNAYSYPLTVGGNSYPVGGSTQSLATLIYDASLDAWIKQGGDLASNNQGLANGVPPELMLQLCIEVGAHPYFCAPVHALDGNTDFMESLATYCRDNAPSWMIPRFEGPNELWNTFQGFYQTYFAQNRQAIINGSRAVNGVLTTTTYSASALVYPVDASGDAWVSGTKYSKITLSTAGNSFVVGSRVNFGAAWGGVASLNNQSAYVGGVNIDGDPNTITVSVVPTTGTYTSGGTIVPNTTDYHNWYGGAMSRLGQVISAVYGDDRSKYQVICGVQTSTGNTSGNRNNSIPRMASTSYVMQAPPSGFTASPASDWVTHLTCAQYFNPSSQTDGTEATYTAAYAGATFTGSISGTTLTTSNARGTIAIGQTIQGIGVNGAAVAAGTVITGGSGTSWTVNNSQTVASMPMVGGQDLTAPISYAASTDTGAHPTNVPNLATLYSNWKAWAQGFGIQKMCGYEGGYTPDLVSGGNSDTDRLKVASKLAPSLEASLTQTFDDFLALTDGTFTAEFPSSYLLASNPYRNGYTQQIWPLLDDIYQSPTPPQWDAIVAFNNS